MHIITQNSEKGKVNNSARKNGGFTIVELVVALAILAILVTIVASFSVLMGDYAKDSGTEYAFLEDVFTLKRTMTEWAAEEDYAGAQFLIDNGSLSVNGKSFSIESGVLQFGDRSMSALSTIAAITVKGNENGLVKCKAVGVKENGVILESEFVFALRAADLEIISEVADDE